MRELAHSESWILVTLAVSATDAEMKKKTRLKGLSIFKAVQELFQITTGKVIVSYLNYLLNFSKSQKHFFLKLYCLKNTKEIFDKTLP